jgi:hypothetical protein
VNEHLELRFCPLVGCKYDEEIIISLGHFFGIGNGVRYV